MLGFWLFMLIMDLVVPLTMLVCGSLFCHHTPKFGSPLGYHTSMSSQNADTWEFAHEYCGRLWRVTGLVMLPVSILAMVIALLYCREIDAIGWWGGILCLVQCVPLVACIFSTERALRKRFNAYGRRREGSQAENLNSI